MARKRVNLGHVIMARDTVTAKCIFPPVVPRAKSRAGITKSRSAKTYARIYAARPRRRSPHCRPANLLS